MRIRIYQIDQATGLVEANSTGVEECDLDEAFPERDDDWRDAFAALSSDKGSFLFGGGAAPLVLLVRADGVEMHCGMCEHDFRSTRKVRAGVKVWIEPKIETAAA